MCKPFFNFLIKELYMAFDFSANFFYTGATQYWPKPEGLTSVYFITQGGGGGGSVASGGGGAYVFTNFRFLNADVSYNVAINVGSGGGAPPSPAGGRSIGGQNFSGNYLSNGGTGTTLYGLQSGGGGGMSSVFYMDPVTGGKIIKIIAGGGGGSGNSSGTTGGNGGGAGLTGSGLGGGEGGNTMGQGDAGLGGIAGGVNGYNYVDSSLNTLYTFQGGGGGNGGTFAGGGGGAGFGGGAGGRQGGGGGGGSYASYGTQNIFVPGAGGAGGAPGQAGANGRVRVLWNSQPPIIPPPIVEMFMLNAQHTSKSIYYAPTLLPNRVLTYAAPGETFPNSAVIGADKEIYIVSGAGVLYALNHDFSFRWKYTLPNHIFFGTPVITANNTLYIAAKATTPPNYLFAIIDTGVGAAITGAIKWQFPLDGNSSVSPLIDLSGVVYIGTDKGSIYAVNDGSSAGLAVWPTPYTTGNVNDAITGTVFDAGYGRICFTATNALTQASTISVMDLSLNNVGIPLTKWTQAAPANEIYNSPSVARPLVAPPLAGSAGTIYVSTNRRNNATGTIYAYDISSSLVNWPPLTILDASLSAIAVNTNKQIYFTSQQALNIVDSSAGTLEWVYPINTERLTATTNSIPLIDASSNVYFGSCDSNMYSINAPTRTFNWKYLAGGPITCMPIIDDVVNLYFGANNGTLYDMSSNGPIVPSTTALAPMYMLNPQHTGLNSTLRGPANAPSITWQKPFVSGNLFVSPSIAIAANGNLYLGSNDANVYAFDTAGNTLPGWPAPIPMQLNDNLLTSPKSLYTTPVIAPDGTLYLGSNEGFLYALTPHGTIKWSYRANYPLQSSPMLDTRGTIYFGAGTQVFAVGDAGDHAYAKWLVPFTTQGNVNSSPALGQNGFLYFGSDDGYLYAVDSFTGLEKWRFNLSLPDSRVHPIYTSATVDTSNNVIIGNGSYMDGSLNYINGITGASIWQTSYDANIGPFYNTVAVNGDTIYLSTIAYVYAIDRVSGQQKYKYFSEAYYYTSPVIDASGVIYVGSITTIQSAPVNQGVLHALTDTGSALIRNWSYPVDNGTGRLAPPVLGANRTLYVSSTANKIYAIG